MSRNRLTLDLSEKMSQHNIEVVSATRDQQSVLGNLLELYAYDLSEVFDLNLGPDGRYGNESLPLYWSESSRFPFLIKVNGYVGGFVLISQGSLISGDANVWDVAEFFVLKRYRRLGIGATVAHEIWGRFPGSWEVRVLETNASAQKFWHTTISAFTGTLAKSVRINHREKQWLLFAFDSSDVTAPNNRSQATRETHASEARRARR